MVLLSSFFLSFAAGHTTNDNTRGFLFRARMKCVTSVGDFYLKSGRFKSPFYLSLV